jgi:hypothetical protein
VLTLRAECECELAGPFHTGVPGVLAAMQDGRLAPGSVVERCDQCERFPTDAAALAALKERGLVNGDAPSRSFTVHCYAVVRVKFPGVVASDEKAAAAQVLDRFDWDTHGRRAAFADEITELLVDAGDDERFERSLRFSPLLEVIDP